MSVPTHELTSILNSALGIVFHSSTPFDSFPNKILTVSPIPSNNFLISSRFPFQ